MWIIHASSRNESRSHPQPSFLLPWVWIAARPGPVAAVRLSCRAVPCRGVPSPPREEEERSLISTVMDLEVYREAASDGRRGRLTGRNIAERALSGRIPTRLHDDHWNRGGKTSRYCPTFSGPDGPSFHSDGNKMVYI